MKAIDVASRLSAELGWRVDTAKVRYFDIRGTMPNLKRTENGFRDYDDKDYKRVKTLATLTSIGISLSDAYNYVEENTEYLDQVIKQKIVDTEKAIKVAKELIK